jgi:hypothetical protein
VGSEQPLDEQREFEAWRLTPRPIRTALGCSFEAACPEKEAAQRRKG